MSYPVIGSGVDGKIYVIGRGLDDNGLPIRMLAKSSPVAPSGVGYDCLFNKAFIVVTWSVAASVICTPFVDRKELRDAAWQIDLPAVGRETSQSFERKLYRDHPSGRSSYRRGIRGVWFQLEIKVVGDYIGGLVSLDGVMLDYDPLTRKRRPDGDPVTAD